MATNVIYVVIFITSIIGYIIIIDGAADQCWSCNSEASDASCRQNGQLQTCSAGDTGGCQTVVRSHGNGQISFSKGCKSESVCSSEVTQYASQCTGHDVDGSVCYYCCTTNKCNSVLVGECISDCSNVPDGDYQSCLGCNVYASCGGGVFYDNRACSAASLVWDDTVKRCEYESSTCSSGAGSDTGSPASECWTCTSAASEEECQSSGSLQSCSSGDYGGCQTEVRSYDNNRMTITKRCKAESVCLSEESQYESQCTGYTVPQSICYHCCTTDNCNYNLPSSETTKVSTASEATSTTATPEPTGTTGPASKCWACTNANDEAMCVSSGWEQTCSEGDTGGCQTEVRVYEHYKTITKRCKAQSVCESEETQYESQCTGYDEVGAICYDCCTTDLCNKNLPDDCASSPCTNGVCEDGIDSYTCDCSQVDYTGAICDQRIDDCADSPCTNGVCLDLVRAFTCDCNETDYEGTVCENKIDDCAESPCTHGTCVDRTRSFACDCSSTDYEGPMCENKINDCATLPCSHGLCVDGTRSFTCDCTGTDYEGQLCQNKIDNCATSPCTNGVCLDGIRTFSCDCSGTDHDGALCENKIDDCANTPCMNGACHDGERTFTCDCTGTDFQGTLCELIIDDCQDSPCNEGTCVDGNQSYTCNCSATSCIGIHCQECPEECVPTYAYLQSGPSCDDEPGEYCYVADVTCSVGNRGECIYNALTVEGGTLQYCDGYDFPVCEVSLTVNGIDGHYRSQCMEAADCNNHNSLTCPDGNLNCTACILPYNPCLVNIEEMPECYDAALHNYMQLNIVDTDVPEIQGPPTGENYYGSWYLVEGSCDCLTNVRRYQRDCNRPTGEGTCRGRPFLLQPCDFLDCVCDVDNFQCWSCEEAASMDDCIENGCWETCDNQVDRMCITTTENYTHPSNPRLSISRGCVTPDVCIDLRFEYKDFNIQMEEIIASTEDISELSEEVYIVKSGVCEPGDEGILGGYNCGAEDNVCVWISDNSAMSWKSGLCFVICLLYMAVQATD